jgi:hypothetical protein
MSSAIETQKTKLSVNALSLTVANVTFTASTKKMTRAAGDWAADGIVAGSIFSTDGVGNKGPFLAATVTALDVTIDTTASLADKGFAIAITDLASASRIVKAGLWVKEMTTFSGFDGEAGDIDVTSLDSTSKEFLSGLRDNGNFKGDFNFLGADPGQVAMRALIASRALANFRLRMSDNSYFDFAAHVKSNPVSGGVDSKVDSSFSMRISGDVTFTAGWVTGA